MKKYFVIYKAEFMSNIAYVSNMLAGFIGYFIIIYIMLNLWQYIYSDPEELINGYTMNQMIWYVIVTEILWSVIGGSKLSKRISNDVKSGNIAYYKATVLLDVQTAVVDYAKSIQEEGGTTLPQFSYIEMACIIDRDGNMLSYTLTEKMTLIKHIVVDITTTTLNKITNIVLSTNQTPTIPEIKI